MKWLVLAVLAVARYGGARPGDRRRDVRLGGVSGRAAASADHEPRRLSLRVDDDAAGNGSAEGQGAGAHGSGLSLGASWPPKPPTPLPEPKK